VKSWKKDDLKENLFPLHIQLKGHSGTVTVDFEVLVLNKDEKICNHVTAKMSMLLNFIFHCVKSKKISFIIHTPL